jgi:hypothetical protein
MTQRITKLTIVSLMEKLTMFNLIKSLIGDFKPNEKRTEMNDSAFIFQT